MTQRSIVTLAIPMAALLLAAPSLYAKKTKPGQENGPVTLVVARPEGNPENAWLGAVTEAYFRYRLLPLSNCGIASPDSLESRIRGYTDYARSVPTAEYRDVGEELGATHVITQNYDADNPESIDYFVEVIRIEGNSTVTDLDRTFPLASLSTVLDSCAEGTIEALGLEPSSDDRRFLGMSMISGDAGSIRELGDLLVSTLKGGKEANAEAAREMARLADRDNRMLLAHFTSQAAYARAGEYEKAADRAKELIKIIPSYLPLYSLVCRYALLARNYGQVATSFEQGVRRGISTPAFHKVGATAYQRMGRDAMAEKAYKLVLKDRPEDIDANLFFARRSNDTKAHTVAIQHADRVLAVDPDNAEALTEKGKALVTLKAPEKAEPVLKKATESSPKALEPALLLADLYADAKKWEAAAEHFDRVIRLEPKEADIYARAARAHEEAGNTDDALAILRKMPGEGKNEPSIIRKRGLLEYETGDRDKARELLEKALPHYGSDGDVLLALAQLYQEKKDLQKASTMYERALPVVKDKKAVEAGLGKLYLAQKRPSKALPLLSKVALADPKAPEINLMAGKAALILGDSARALSFFVKERAVSKGRVPEDIQKEIARLTYKMKSPAEAAKELERVLELDPANPDAYRRLAISQLQLGNVGGAMKSLAEARKLGPADAAVYEELGDGFARNKAGVRAMEQYEKSLEQNPKQTGVWEKLAELQEQAGKHKELAESYLSLYRLDNAKYKDKLAEAGHLYLKTKQPKKAEEAYASFVKKGFSDPAVSIRYAGILFDRKQYKEVIDLLAPLKQPDAAKDTVVAMLGRSYFATKQLDKAAAHLAKLAPKRQGDPLFVAMTAEACDSSGKASLAVRYYEELLELRGAKAGPDPAHRLGLLLEKQGAITKAIARYEENLRLFPKDLRNHLRLVERYRKANNTTSLLTVLKKAVELPKAPPELHRELAELLAARKAGDQAIVHYEHYLTATGTSTDSSAFYMLGTLYYGKKEYKKAIEPLKAAVRLMPRNDKALVMLARAYKRTGALGNAASTFQSLVKLGKADTKIVEELAECYRQEKDTTNLISALDMLLQHRPRDYDLLKEQGRLLVARGDHAKAAKVLEGAAGIKPNEIGLRLALARTYEALGKTKERTAHLEKAVALGSKEPGVHADLAKLYEADGKNAAAAKHFAAALSLSGKKDQDLAYHIGELLEKANRITEATKRYERNVDDYPKDIRNYLRLVALYRKAGNTQKLEGILGKAVNMPDAPPVLDRHLAEIMHKKKNTSGAILHYEKYVAQAPKDSTALLTLGSLYYDKEDYGKAVVPLRSAAKLMPSNVECLTKLARAAKKSGQLDQAITSYEALRKLGNPGKEILAELADCYRKKGEAEKLVGVLREQIALAPKHFDWLKELGMLLLEKGRNGEAAEALERAVALKPKDVALHLELARTYEKLKEPARQIAHLESARSVKTNDPDIHFELGRLYESRGNDRKAMTAYRKAIQYKSDHDKARFRYAELLLKDKKVEEARKQLEEAVKANRSVALYHVRLAETWAALGNYAKARKALDGAMEVEPANVDHLVQAAEMDEKLGDLNGAHDLLQMAATKDPKCTKCLAQLGVLASRTGDYQGVVRNISEVFERGGYNDTLAMYLGDAYTQLGETDKATEVFERIMSSSPTNTEALYRLVHQYIDKGDIDKAQEMRRKHHVMRETGWTHLLAAELKENAELYDEALKSYMIASKLLPESPESYAGMARVYLSKNNADEAIMMVGRAMAYDPENPDYFLLMGNAYEEMKQYEAALSSYGEAEKRDPANPEVHFCIGRAHGRAGKFRKAAQALEKGLSYEPKNPKLHMAMGHVLRAMNKPEKAIQAYEEAARRGGDEYKDAYMYLGLVYYKLVDNDNSLKYLKRYKKKGGENPKVDELIDELRK